MKVAFQISTAVQVKFTPETTIPLVFNSVSMPLVNGANVEFRKGTGTIAANKAYLPAASVAGAPSLDIVFDQGTTGISEIEKMRNVGKETYYDLQGRKVSELKPGLYIVNGRKVLRP